MPRWNDMPAAMPTFIATSGVIGKLLARPRMPSVPKYRLDIRTLTPPQILLLAGVFAILHVVDGITLCDDCNH
jgi:hypothetical protein